jgi:hypothetical protein
MTRATKRRIVIGAIVGISVALGVAMLVEEVGTTRIDPTAEFPASSRQIGATLQALRRAGPVRTEADLARLKATVAALVYKNGRIAYPVTLSLTDRIVQLVPRSVDPAQCRSEAYGNAMDLGRAVSDAKKRPCADDDPAAAGRCIMGHLGALARGYDRFCKPR